MTTKKKKKWDNYEEEGESHSKICQIRIYNN
jgi:hypothetical protein